MNNLAKLIIRAGGEAGAEIKIDKDTVTFGRESSHEIVLDDDEVSRSHARIFYRAESFYIEDLHSTNGTFVNGKRVRKKIKIKDKDLITIGERYVFEFSLKDDATTDLDSSDPTAREKEIQENLEPIPSIGFVKNDKDPEEVWVEKDVDAEEIKFLSRFPKWALVLFIAIGFFILFCLIPLVVIEVTDQWCNLFSGFFNAIRSGVCP